MGDPFHKPIHPILPPPPPPTPPPPPKSNLPMLYYGLVVVGTAAIVLAVYNLIIIKWCARRQQRWQPHGLARTAGTASSRSFDTPSINLVSSFKYKKEGGGNDPCEYECPVCLSVFEEGEEVRQLPRCKHSFHAPCIDMWIYSHSDCPLCRSPVEPPVLRRQVEMATPSEHSRQGLLARANTM